MSALVDVMTARGVSASVDALIETGAMASLLEGERSATELCETHDLDPLALARVLDVLEVAGVVSRDGDRFRVADSSYEHLVGLDGTPWSTMLWRHTADFLRSGDSLLPPRDLDELGAAYARFIGALAQKFDAYARAAADALLPRLPNNALILDVGAGSGVWSFPLLSGSESARLVALDLPPVAEKLEARAAAAGLGDRATMLPGDYHEVLLPRDVDVALLANVLHLEAPHDARALVARVVDATAPGGLVIVVDTLEPPDERQRAIRSTYALHLAMRVPGGFPHAERDIRDWLVEAGCSSIERLLINNRNSGGVLVAIRGEPS